MKTVIIGAGHAGVQTAESLRSAGYDGGLVLMDKDVRLPYQRPPLSKDFMKADGDPSPMPLRGEAFYKDHAIDLLLGATVASIDASHKRLTVDDGTDVHYDRLVIAAGADARRAECSGSKLEGIAYLRTIDDAKALRLLLDQGHGRVVVVGAGFIGLEFAAIAAQRGLDVTIIDFAQRPMQRVLSPSMSDYFLQLHRALGITFHFDEGLARFTNRDGHVSAVVGTSGAEYPCDFAVIGLGVVTDDALAATAGISCNHGVVVDKFLQTSVVDIFAVGDLAVFPSKHFGGNLRLESVQNATDMAKTVAKTITGTPTSYDIAPWFWSNQGSAKLQIAGLADPADIVIERGDRTRGKFSQFLFRDEQLTAVESVNAPADHVAARKLLEHGGNITMEQARDHQFDFKSFARELAATQPAS